MVYISSPKSPEKFHQTNHHHNEMFPFKTEETKK